MSLVPDEPQVNAWLREHGIQHEICELQRDADLCPDRVPELLQLLKSPLSLYMHVAVAEALFARKLKRAQRQEAVDVLLTIIKQNSERWGSLSSLVLNELADNVGPENVHEIGQMALDKRYGPMRSGFVEALRKIGNEDAISYLKEVAKDRHMTPYALAKLGSLGLPETLGMCEEALQKPDMLYKDVIQETYVKLKRKLSKKGGHRSS